MAEDPPPPDIRLPTLDVTLDDAYSVTGYNYIDLDTPKSDGTEPTFARPEESEFLVDCAGIRAAENVLIDEGRLRSRRSRRSSRTSSPTRSGSS
jgi:hypothetical protein